MGHTLVTSEGQLAELCRRLADADRIAFDTEFVSEHSYRPKLCLVQIAAGDERMVVDPLAAGDMSPFWETIAGFEREIIVHAGREEMAFCLESAGRQPRLLCDVQIAAGLAGLEYPAGYGTLVTRLLGKKQDKGETRTDWRKRPLTDRQIAYAVDDVRHLAAIRDALGAKLEALKRMEWLRTEMADWQAALAASLGGERWRRVSGSTAMSARGLAVVRELWLWRDAEARQRDRPSRQILRDDLIVELAKRRTADARHIGAVRGFERGDLKRALPELGRAISRALALPDEECPRPQRRDSNSHLTMVGQFLSSALSSICRSRQVSPSLVGTTDDVRELIAYRLGGGNGPPPELTQGWRAEVVGQMLEDLLTGKVAIRIRDPNADDPLVFEPAESNTRSAP